MTRATDCTIIFAMDRTEIREKAERIRDAIRYVKKFKNSTVIIYIDDTLINSPVFANHVRDICMIHEAGLKVIVVPGAGGRISEILSKSGIGWTIHENCRVTEDDAMPLIKMAAFDVSNRVMTSFAGEGKTAVIGNWVRARGKGIVNGFDYGTSGEIDKLQTESINTILENGFIPIFPCIGWSLSGKPYNISSIELSQQIAIHLKADKLFFLVPGAEINGKNFKIPKSIEIAEDENIPALNLDEVDEFLKINEPLLNSADSNAENTKHSVVLEKNIDKKNVSHETNSKLHEKIFILLNKAKSACLSGVPRIHILNGSLDGIVPCEIFSDLGSGTMIYSSGYEKIRDMKREDINSVLNLMQPFIEKQILLPRTRESLAENFRNYIVYELDGIIRACASLIPYTDGQTEIAGVAVDESFSHIGIGQKIIKFLVKRAESQNSRGIFLLTTQTADWFEKLGFSVSSVESLPEERRKKWNPERGSKVLRLEK